MGLFRKQTQCIAIILSLLIVSGTYVFTEEFSGVGLVLQVYEKNMWLYPEMGQTFKYKRFGYEYFVSPIPNSPAKRAGMPELAKLIAVDGRDVDVMDPGAVARRIQGPAGSTVVLRVLVEEERGGIFGRYIKEYALMWERIVMPNQDGKHK